MATKPASNKDTTPSRGTENLHIRISDDLKKRLRHYVTDAGTTMQDLVVELIERELPKTS